MTLKVLLKLLKPESKYPSKELRADITYEQKGRCAKCGTECKLEIDHKHQIATCPFKRNGKDNLVGLCTECHMEKTMAQGGTDSSGVHNPIMS